MKAHRDDRTLALRRLATLALACSLLGAGPSCTLVAERSNPFPEDPAPAPLPGEGEGEEDPPAPGEGEGEGAPAPGEGEGGGRACRR